MIFAAILIIFASAAIPINYIVSKYYAHTNILSAKYSTRMETKTLPEFSYLVVKSNFSVWFQMYTTVGQNAKATLITPDSKELDISKGNNNEIELPQNIMNYSTFVMHGDTMVITLGCQKDFAKEMFCETGNSNIEKSPLNSYRATVKTGGTYYELKGCIYKSPKMRIRLRSDVKMIKNASPFCTTIHKLSQDTLSLITESASGFQGCRFNKLRIFNTNITTPSIFLFKTQVGKYYLHLNTNSNSIDDIVNSSCTDGDSRIDEYYIVGGYGNSRNSVNNSKPFTVHWTPE